MWPHYKVRVVFTNGSDMSRSFHSLVEAYEFANNLSFSGDQIERVIMQSVTGGTYTIWCRVWDDVSKTAGLKCPP
jgi:hypothetical protein